MNKALIPCKQCSVINRIDLDREGTPKCGKCQSQLVVNGGVVELDLQGLRTVIASSPVPVITDFWAPWCGPCQYFGPTYANAAKKHAGRFIFTKVNTQDHEDAGAAFGIRGIPAILVFADGKERTRQAGAMDPTSFDSFLLRHQA